MSNYEAFQDACDAELEDDQLTMTPGHDEAAAQIFGRDSAWPASEGGIMSELVETGSVTVSVAGKRWVLSLHAEEQQQGHCRAKGPEGYLCTEPSGHSGEHIARGSNDDIYERWVDDPPDETDTYRQTEPPLLGGGS